MSIKSAIIALIKLVRLDQKLNQPQMTLLTNIKQFMMQLRKSEFMPKEKKRGGARVLDIADSDAYLQFSTLRFYILKTLNYLYKKFNLNIISDGAK